MSLPERIDRLDRSGCGVRSAEKQLSLPERIDRLDCEIAKMRKTMISHDADMELLKGVSRKKNVDNFFKISLFNTILIFPRVMQMMGMLWFRKN